MPFVGSCVLASEADPWDGGSSHGGGEACGAPAPQAVGLVPGLVSAHQHSRGAADRVAGAVARRLLPPTPPARRAMVCALLRRLLGGRQARLLARPSLRRSFVPVAIAHRQLLRLHCWFVIHPSHTRTRIRTSRDPS